MNTQIRTWDPFQELFRMHEQLQRAFEPRSRGTDAGELAAVWEPVVDICEDNEAITLSADLPGVDQKAIDLRIEGNTLTIRGERKLERAEERDCYHRIERAYGTFSRSFTVPSSVDAENIQAQCRDGVLTVTLPKRPESKPRQIKVAVEGPMPKLGRS